MAILRLKSSSANTTPAILTARELAIHKDKLFFGSNDNKPIELIDASATQLITGKKLFLSDIELYNGSGANDTDATPALIFTRGTDSDGVTDWKIYNDNSGILCIAVRKNDTWTNTAEFYADGTLLKAKIPAQYNGTTQELTIAGLDIAVMDINN